MNHVSASAAPTRWAITATLSMSVLLAALGTSIANIALPTLVKTFAAPFLAVQTVVVAYLLTMTVSSVFVGRFGDIYGLRRVLLAGLFIYAAASLLCGSAPSLWLLVAARALQGVGAAILMTLAMALMRETTSQDRLGRAMGLLGTVSAIGTALGPSLGGALIPTMGWRGIFLVQAPLAGMAFILAVIALPTSAPPRGATAPRLWTALEQGMMPSLLINALVAAVMMTTLVVGPFYLGRSLTLSDAAVGLVMSVGPIISIVSGVPSGRAVDRWGTRRVSELGLCMLAAGAFALAVLPNLIGLPGYMLGIAMMTPGYQLFQAANNTAVLAHVQKERRGLVSGLLTLSRNTGLILGASVMGAVFALGVGSGSLDKASAAAIASGMRMTFILAGGLMISALWILRRTRSSVAQSVPNGDEAAARGRLLEGSAR